MKNVNLKIYWVTTVWPKWQIIIPKECRGDYSIDIWTEFELAMVDKSAFGLGLPWKCDEEKEKEWKLIESQGFINIWTKFQFVIPLLIRNELWINSKDSLIVVWKSDEWLGFIKNDKIEYLL